MAPSDRNDVGGDGKNSSLRPIPPLTRTARPKDGPHTGERKTKGGSDCGAKPPLHPPDQGTSR
jgi:hypothetical protein